MHRPRLIISGLKGGTGKTMVSLALSRALARSGLRVRSFKKGPDYIDAAWLSLASKGPQGNLDPYFSSAKELRRLFTEGSAGADIAVIEGNRGLFDGLDINGSYSTSELARILAAPVLLVIDCTKMTRTTAALVKGCLDFEPGLSIGGVILNRTGSERHQAIVTQAVEELAGVPVLGVLPRHNQPLIAERHMGLHSTQEQEAADACLDALADFFTSHADIGKLFDLARSAPPLLAAATAGRDDSGILYAANHATPKAAAPLPEERPATAGRTIEALPRGPHIGYIRDQAFWFYYRENLEALEKEGARLTPLSLLDHAAWPDVDGLYIGGGQPELYAGQLAANDGKRRLVASLARAGAPVYAECGGFMYLAQSLRVETDRFPMAGVFPAAVEFCKRPQGLGYVEAEVVRENPFLPFGLRLRGHEFHFSRCSGPLPSSDATKETAASETQFRSGLLRLFRGQGMGTDTSGARTDGLLYKNTFASYMHIYAPAVPAWAASFVRLCEKHREERGAPDGVHGLEYR